MTPDLRCKVITIITIDVHGKDVVEKYITTKISDSASFEWQQQLKFFWIEENSEITYPSPVNNPDAKKNC